jgi:Cu/Ag efflux protein CusF
MKRVLNWQQNTSILPLFLKETVLKTNKIIATIATFAFASILSVGVAATAATDNNVSIKKAATQTADMTSGQVRKIDKETGKLTLKHERIASLNMPPMTMVFRVKEKSMLNALQIGDTILFKAVDTNGVLTITEIK